MVLLDDKAYTTPANPAAFTRSGRCDSLRFRVESTGTRFTRRLDDVTSQIPVDPGREIDAAGELGLDLIKRMTPAMNDAE